ncbi:hypothetical protein KKH05_00545 [Patescibacteria group bacterium]|nr:hypothetical protein [Patescibacteria group bacterium]
MTIVRPNRDKDIKRTIILCGAGVVTMVAMVVVSYVSLVSAKHDLEKTRVSLESMKVENAELKNQYFEMTNVESLERFASEMGLVKDKNPGWVLASQY